MSAGVSEEDVVLAGPARQRLLELASEVLGRLPPEDVPASLRAIARFTPSKRHRVGAPTLAAAIDAEPQFRAKLAEVVGEAFPQLVEALHAGTSTAASDPIDTAVVAYVVRPEGWPGVVADAIARWSDERRDTSAAELDRLRTELAELRAHARSEPARRRDEVVAALAAQGAELDQLRKTLRTRTGELRAAERDRDEARRAVEDVRAAAGAAGAAREAELKKLRARVAELERAAEANRRGARTERDLDDARLRLLLDTVLDATAGLRRELDLPRVAVRPADTVQSADGAGGTRAVADGAGLDRLLELPQAHLIVDGYNVTKTGYGDLPLVDQRTRLVTALAALQSRAGVEVTVAFDGSTKPPAAPHVPRGLRVLFSAPDETADDLIRRLVAAEPPGRPLVVVTADREIVADVQREGAWTVPSAVLLARLG
jgi:predicted RNA-binding protein with PIN domain